MRKSKLELLHTQLKTLAKSMKFSDLDEETQRCLTQEMLFFNKRRISALSWVVLAIEILNLINVLFFSRSGLESVNNRQYFSMYLLLMVGACVCIAAPRLLGRSQRGLWWFYVGFMTFWVLWCAVLSTLDLRSNPNIIVFTTGIFVLACLARLKPWESISVLSGGLIVLFFCAWSDITNGVVINVVIVTLTAMLISVSRYFATLEELRYRQKLIRQADRQTEDKVKLAFYLKQQQALLDSSGELLFIWDGETKQLTISDHTSDKKRAALQSEAYDAVSQWLEDKAGEQMGRILLQCDEESDIRQYEIEAIWQLNSDNKPVGAAGRLTLCPAEPV